MASASSATSASRVPSAPIETMRTTQFETVLVGFSRVDSFFSGLIGEVYVLEKGTGSVRGTVNKCRSMRVRAETTNG